MSPFFKKSILKFIRPYSRSIFNCHIPNGIKLITKLRLGLSYLREHKFRHNFQNTLNLICSCGYDIVTKIHYLLHCSDYLDERRTLLDNLQGIGENNKNASQISELLLFAFLQIMMHQIQVFWMLPSNIYWLLKGLTSILLTLESFEIFTFVNTYVNTAVFNNSSHKI